MSDEIFFNGIRYIAASSAAANFGFTRDYIAILCRNGKVQGRRVGRNWYVDEDSLKSFVVKQEHSRANRRRTLTEDRVREYRRATDSRPNFADSALRELREKGAALTTIASAHGARIADKAIAAAKAPAGATEEILRAAAAVGAHAPMYTVTPAGEFLNKAFALTLALVLTFGTYAVVDPTYARFALGTSAESVREISRTYENVRGVDMRALATNVKVQVALAGASPAAAAASVFDFVPRLTAHIAQSVNASVNNFVFAVAFPGFLVSEQETGYLSRGTVAVRIEALPTQIRTPQRTGVTQNISRTVNTGPTTVLNQSVIERVVETERIFAAGGISEEILSARLQELDNRLSSRMYSLTNANTTAISQTYHVVSQTNRIDSLDDVDLSAPTITGGTITNASISNSTISGATLSGTTTISLLSLGSSTTTASNGFNIADGCFAINGTCVTGSGGTAASSTLLADVNAWSSLNTFSSGLLSLASTTIGNGTATGGLTISGGATTTGNLIVQGTGTSTFAAGIQTTALNITSTTATSTAANGWNITTGCYAVNGTCLSSGSSASSTLLADVNAWSGLNRFNAGLLSFASTTIGDGTAIGGLTISGGATTTGDAYFASNIGIGASPYNGSSVRISSSTPYFVLTDTDDTTRQNYRIGNEDGIFRIASFNSSFASQNNDLVLDSQNNNYYIGEDAGFFETTGGDNIAIGYTANISNRSGTYNVAIGSAANNNNLSATNTVAVGGFAGNGSGQFNSQGYVAVGYSAGFRIQTGSDFNTLIGYQAGSRVSTGLANILVGSHVSGAAANNITTGSGNIGLGNELYFQSSTANNQLNIGGLIFGTLPATSTAWLLPTSGTIGIGTTSPTSKFGIAANSGDTLTTLFQISSSTASATTTLFSISNTGALTQLGGASSSFSNGLNITTGCYAVNGTCLSTSGSSASSTLLADLNTWTGLQTFANITATGATSTSLFSTTASSTNLFSNAATIGTFTAGTGAFSGAITSTATGANTFPYASSTALSVSGTSYFGTATSTSLFANTASIGALTGGTGSFSSTLGVTGLSTLSGGLLSLASTTIGDGTQLGGLTISGGATTTGNAYFANNVGIGTTSPFAKFAIVGSAGLSTTSPLFQIASSSNLAGGVYASISSRGFLNLKGRAIDPEFVAEERGTTPGTTLDTSISITVVGNYAYVTNKDRDSLAVIDISNPADPVFIAEERGTTPGTTLDGALSVFVSGNYAYVTNNFRDSLAVIDISNPADPEFIAEELGPIPGTTLDGARSVFVSGKYAYVTTQFHDSLAVIDISNPADPVFIAEEQGTTPGTTLDAPLSVFVAGNYAYVANTTRDSLAVIDISNPADPVFIAEERGTTPGTTLDGARSVFVSGKYAYVASDARSSLAVIDISNPADPVFIAEERGTTAGITLGAATAVFVSGNYAYVTTYTRNSLAVIDISNPTDPVFIAEERGTTPGTTLAGASSVFVSGNYAYMVNQTRDSLAVIDVGGATISNLAVGTARVGNLSVDSFAQFAQGGYFGGSLMAQGSIFGNQGGTFLRVGTTSPIASTTLAWGSYIVPPALSAVVHDASVGGITDVFSLTHTATGTVSNGIGTGMLFNDQTYCSLANCAQATSSATSTARIASIFTNVSTSSPASALSFSTKNSAAGLTEWMRLTSSGSLGIGTTTPNWKLVSIDSSGPQLSIGDGTSDSWAFRGAGGNFFLATSTYSATSSVSALAINGTTGAFTFNSGATSTFSSGLQTTALNITSTSATSTAANGFNITTGCFAVNGTCLSSGSSASSTLLQSDTNTFTNLTTFTGGIRSFASSTIGAGGATTGLTISGGATTTGLHKFSAGLLSIASSTFTGNLSVGTLLFGTGNASDRLSTYGGNAFVTASSTAFNTSVGESALGNITSGVRNTAFGYNAMINATSTSRNTAMGYNALACNGNDCSGTDNSAFGTGALGANTTGIGNIAIGYDTLGGNTSGEYNVSIGNGSLNGNTTGRRNVAIGTDSLNVSNSDNNISIGFQTGNALTSGTNNILLGYDIDAPLDAGSNQLSIGNLIYGIGIDGAGKATSTGSIGIGTSSPTSVLAVQKIFGNTAASIFSVSSSTAVTGNTQSSFLSVSSTGFGTTTLSGLNISGSATSTSNVGFNLTTGCFAISGSCLTGGITGTQGFTTTFNAGGTQVATSTLYITDASKVGISTTTGAAKLTIQGVDQLAASKSFEVADSTGAKLAEIFNDGLTKLKNLLVTASSTIGGGTQTTGLTINGGATTTGALVVQGTSASSTFAGNVEIDGALKVGTGSIYLNGAATSTFSAGVQFSAINVTSSTATSTFANGINLNGGCFTATTGGPCLTPTGLNGTLLGTFATSTPGSNVRVVLTGAAGSQPSFSAGVLTLPSNTSYFEVETWGAGGGGGSGGSSGNNGNSGSTGGTSSFGSGGVGIATSTATGGGGGGGGWISIAGGSAGAGSGGDVNMSGGSGEAGNPYDATAAAGAGGDGGSAPSGGGGGGGGAGSWSGAGTAGAAFGGGGSGGGDTASSGTGGGGGGAGGYSERLVTSPSGTYYYNVGAGGSAGSAVTNGAAGGAGGAGGFVVRVYTTVSANGTSGGQLLGIYSTSTVGTTTVQLTGAAGSAPSFSGGVLTLPSNASTVIVKTWGAGGGGGAGGTSVQTSHGSGGGGGGSGGYAQKLVTSPSGTYYFSVGAGGSAAGNGNYSCFGSSSIACSSPLVAATGGSAGGSGASNAGGGGAGGNGDTGDVRVTGGPGDSGGTGDSSGATYVAGGAGGKAPEGGGGGQGGTVGGNGSNGNGFGGGGGGGSGGAGGGSTGGTGGAGGIVIEVYATGLTSGSVGTGTAGQFAYYDSAGTQITATSSLSINTTTGALTGTNGFNLTGGCFSINSVCIGYVKRLAGIYATSTVGTTTVSFGTGGPSFSGGTLTIPATTTEMVVEVWGAGGGGSGNNNNGGASPGAGGGSGGYAQELVISPTGTYYYTVGAGGAGASGGGSGIGTGGTGATSCFGTNSTACVTPTLSATGGSGGAIAGGLGGDGVGGNLNLTGAPGGFALEGGNRGGHGGSAPRGGGGGLGTTAGGAGQPFGGGGGGSNSANTGGNGGAGGIVITVYATSSPTAAGNDYAEMFPVSSPDINAADIVAVDVGSPISMKRAKIGDTLAGVIATQPGQILGDINAPGMRPVALMGRVPVKVNMEGGPIKIGDRVAVSSVAGVGKKAGVFDASIGIAIANYPDDGTSPESTPDGTVMVFVTLQSPPSIQMIGEGLLAEQTGDNAYDFVGNLLATISSRITTTGAGFSLIPGVAQSGLAVVQSFNAIYNSTPSTNASSSPETLVASSTAALLDYLTVLPSLSKAIGELDQRTAFIENLAGTSTIMRVNADGTVSINTTATSTHTLNVGGSIGATSFIATDNTASETPVVLDDILTSLSGVQVFTAASSTRFALDMNSIPQSIRSGDGIDLYQLGLYNLSGLNALKQKIDILASTTAAFDLRVGDLETAIQDLRAEEDVAPTFGIWTVGATTTAHELVTELADVSTTSTSTGITTSPFTGRFATSSATLREGIASLADTVVQIWGKATYAITGIFDRVFAREVYTEKLCIEDICVTKEDLKNLLHTAGAASGARAGGGTENEGETIEEPQPSGEGADVPVDENTETPVVETPREEGGDGAATDQPLETAAEVLPSEELQTEIEPVQAPAPEQEQPAAPASETAPAPEATPVSEPAVESAEQI